MNNTYIRTTLGALLEVLDARTTVMIYGRKNDSEDKLLYNQFRVYEVLTHDGYEEFINCTVIGFSTNMRIVKICIAY